MSQQQTKYGQEQDKNVARKLDLDQQKQREVLKGSAGTTGTADWRSNEMKGANFQAQQQQQNILGSQQYQSDLSNIGQQKIGEFDLQSDLQNFDKLYKLYRLNQQGSKIYLQQRKLAKEGELGQQNVEYSSYEQLQNLGLGQQQIYEKVRETILGQEHTAQQQFAGKASQTQIPDPNFSLHRDKKIE